MRPSRRSRSRSRRRPYCRSPSLTDGQHGAIRRPRPRPTSGGREATYLNTASIGLMAEPVRGRWSSSWTRSRARTIGFDDDAETPVYEIRPRRCRRDYDAAPIDAASPAARPSALGGGLALRPGGHERRVDGRYRVPHRIRPARPPHPDDTGCVLIDRDQRRRLDDSGSRGTPAGTRSTNGRRWSIATQHRDRRPRSRTWRALARRGQRRVERRAPSAVPRGRLAVAGARARVLTSSYRRVAPAGAIGTSIDSAVDRRAPTRMRLDAARRAVAGATSSSPRRRRRRNGDVRRMRRLRTGTTTPSSLMRSRTQASTLASARWHPLARPHVANDANDGSSRRRRPGAEPGHRPGGEPASDPRPRASRGRRR